MAAIGKKPDFDRVEDLIADIAAIFHWSYEFLGNMRVREILAWQVKAVERWNRMYGAPE